MNGGRFGDIRAAWHAEELTSGNGRHCMHLANEHHEEIAGHQVPRDFSHNTADDAAGARGE